MTNEKLIKAAKFDWVSDSIKKFPYIQPRKGDTKVFQFDSYVTSEEAVRKMQKEGYEPATLSELLIFAEKEWNSSDWIIALGSVAELGGDRNVPCLGRYGAKRGLNLTWWDSRWDDSCRFLAVRNNTLDLKTQSLPSDTLILEARIAKLEEAMDKIRTFLII